MNGEIVRLALDFIRREQARMVHEISDRKAREAALKDALARESKPLLDRMVAFARNLEPICDVIVWDANPWIVAAPNGVIDLQTGCLRAGDPADLITLMLGTPYDPEANAPRWTRFLAEIFSDDADLIAWTHRFLGYCLTGITTEQVLALFYGTGGNGKGSLIETVSHVLGDYATNLPFATMELSARASIPNDLAKLPGRRFVTASETNDGIRLNEARIKMLTGCDTVTARYLHAEWFSFRPVAKFVLAVNHRPTVRDDSFGFWRRIRLVPFLRQFPINRALEGELRVEAAGILTWAVQGCLEWQQQGLGAPASVVHATEDYHADSDPLADFLEEACDCDPALTIRASELQAAYVKWCDARRLSKADRLSAKDFGRRMADRFPRRHTMTGWIYSGVRVNVGGLF